MAKIGVNKEANRAQQFSLSIIAIKYDLSLSLSISPFSYYPLLWFQRRLWLATSSPNLPVMLFAPENLVPYRYVIFPFSFCSVCHLFLFPFVFVFLLLLYIYIRSLENAQLVFIFQFLDDEIVLKNVRIFLGLWFLGQKTQPVWYNFILVTRSILNFVAFLWLWFAYRLLGFFASIFGSFILPFLGREEIWFN